MLDNLLEAFRQAVLDKDWVALGDVDAQLRTELSAQIALCHTPEQQRSMVSLLKRLQKIYSLAQRNAQADHEAVALELAKLKQDQRAVRAYQQGGNHYS